MKDNLVNLRCIQL